jgi:hypothetical protein
MQAVFLWIILVFFLWGSMTEKKSEHVGVVEVEFQLYKELSTPAFKQSHRIWFKDSMAIKEVKITGFETDTAGKQTMKEATQYYLFADLTTNSFYEYNTFSDTAHIRKDYFENDTSQVTDASELYFKKKINDITPGSLNDTTIENISYKRIRFKRPGKNSICIAYLRCDVKSPLFEIYKYKGQICPIAKTYDYAMDNSSSPVVSVEVKFLSDTLTSEEKKVFIAWEKNAKEHPVSR